VSQRHRRRPELECLEERTLLNSRFVVPAGTMIDNQTTFATLQAALTTSGLSAGDIIQIEPGSSPGSITNANLPALANLTIQGDPTAGLTAIPTFNITDAVTISASQAGFSLKGVNVNLLAAGSLTFNANASILGSTVVDANSSALNALTLSGPADVLGNSTLVNNASLTLGSSLVLVSPSAGSSNQIMGDTFVANAQVGALLAYQASAAVSIKDQVGQNSFIGNAGSNVADLLLVGQPLNTVTSSGAIGGLTISDNTFTDPDTDVTAIALDSTSTATQVAANQITLTAATSLNRGIVVLAGPAGTTVSANLNANQINTNGFGTGLEIDLGSDTTSVLNLVVEGNDFHNNAIGVLIQPGSATSTASVSGIDLGVGSPGALGGNNFRGFSAQATATSGAIVLNGVGASQGKINAESNLFNAGATPASVVFDPNSNLDISNPLTGNAAYVQTLYEDLLNRVGDTTSNTDAGFWVTALNNSTLTQAAVANDIAHSQAALTNLVSGLYLKLLGRTSDTTGATFFINLLKGGDTLEQVISMMVSSQEYTTDNSSDGAFVQSLYNKLLGRVGSSSELAFWIAQLPTLGRTGVANEILASPEFRGDVVQQLYGFTSPPSASVANLFSNLLHRTSAPATADIDFWVNSKNDVLAIQASIAGSDEFFGGGAGSNQALTATLPALHRQAPIVPALTRQVFSTVPTNGDVNPYGVAVVPQGIPSGGILQPGDILVANFNNSSNTQGTGTTIERITPTGQTSTFFTSTQLGLSTGLVALKSGLVVVANVPNVSNAPGQGSLQFIDSNGNLVSTLTDANLLNGPWDLTANDQGNTVQLFVSNVSKNVSATASPNGTVTRIDLQIQNGKPVVQDMVQIASGYATRTDPAAFVVGPGGLAYNASTNTLYVASQAEKVNGTEVGTIFAIANAGTTTTDNGKGTVVYADPVHLHGPIGLALAPNGDLIAANSDAVNADPNQPSELVEFTTAGQFVGQFSVDPNNAGAFGLAVFNSGGQAKIAAVDDDTNTLSVWNFVPGFGNLQVYSTVPPQTGATPPPADVNPYGVAYVPQGFQTGGTLQPGDLLVANFNNPANVQGTGSTIVRITPTGQTSTFFTSTQPGLDTGLVVLKSGFVIVANVPDVAGLPGQGSLQILDSNGNLVSTLTDANLLNGPWDLAVNDQGNTVQVFVSNVSKNISATASPNGTVTRIDLQIQNGKPVVQDMVQIASGYATRTDPNAFVVGPAGLAFDAATNTLYVASQAEKVNGTEVGTIFAIANASTTAGDHGEGTVVYADPVHLHGPIGLVLAPNGDLIAANSDAVNADPNQPSELVEFTTTGQFVGQFSVDPNNAGAFGLALSSINGQLRVAAVDDNVGPGNAGSPYSEPTVSVWTFETGIDFPV
jgi:Domain of unknown function (DUF4214)